MEDEKRKSSFNHSNCLRLEKGDSFGELAESRDFVRSNIAIASSDCHLAILTQSNYFNIMGDLERDKIDIEMNNMVQFPIFESLHSSILKKIYFGSRKESFRHNHIICEQGISVENAFVVYEGSVTARKKLKMPKKLLNNSTLQKRNPKIIYQDVCKSIVKKLL